MPRSITLAPLTMTSLGLVAATKYSGTTVLKDVQRAGTTDKTQKHQRTWVDWFNWRANRIMRVSVEGFVLSCQLCAGGVDSSRP
jgi:hypothetical protein